MKQPHSFHFDHTNSPEKGCAGIRILFHADYGNGDEPGMNPG
ncbi:hypothetical protein [uncultured Methanospirillum sp.]|nr:hypothetical protein [uncultured Methanospirillum sp.]